VRARGARDAIAPEFLSFNSTVAARQSAGVAQHPKTPLGARITTKFRDF
jgi:hypothetical protein